MILSEYFGPYIHFNPIMNNLEGNMHEYCHLKTLPMLEFALRFTNINNSFRQRLH